MRGNFELERERKRTAPRANMERFPKKSGFLMKNGREGHNKQEKSIKPSSGGPTGGPPITLSGSGYKCDIYFLESMKEEYKQLLSDDTFFDKNLLKNISININPPLSLPTLKCAIPGLRYAKQLPCMCFKDQTTGRRTPMVSLAGLAVQDVKAVVQTVLYVANKKLDITFVASAAKLKVDELLKQHKISASEDAGTEEKIEETEPHTNPDLEDILDILRVPLGEKVPKYRCILVFPYDEQEQYTELISGNFYHELEKMSDDRFTIFYSEELMTNEVIKVKVLPGLSADNVPCFYFWETGNMEVHRIIELEDLDNHQIAKVVRTIRAAFDNGEDLNGAATAARNKIKLL